MRVIQTYLSGSCSSGRNDMKLSEYSEGGARYTLFEKYFLQYAPVEANGTAYEFWNTVC
jgi:hypothetical protein